MKNLFALLIPILFLTAYACLFTWYYAKEYYTQVSKINTQSSEVLIEPGSHHFDSTKTIVSITRGNTIEYKDGSLMHHGPIINIGDNYSIGLPIGTDFDSLVESTITRIQNCYEKN